MDHRSRVFADCRPISLPECVYSGPFVQDFPSFVSAYHRKLSADFPTTPFFRLNLKRCESIRLEIAISQNVERFRACVEQLQLMFGPFHEGKVVYEEEEGERRADNDFNLRLPPWICQPYIRMDPGDHVKMLAEKQEAANDPERVRPVYLDDDGQEISRKLMKKLRRSSRRPHAKGMRCKDERTLPLCQSGTDCVNPMGTKCAYELCRVCCRVKCYANNLDCAGHKLFPQSKRRKVAISVQENASVLE